MPTNLIRVFHFTALCARSCSAAALLALSMHASTAPTDCESQPLTPQQKLERFHELDARAQSAMQAKRFAEAVQIYEQAVCLAPSSPRGLYGLGVAEAASGDCLKARESLHTDAALQPTSP